MNRNTNAHFSELPSVDIQRSMLDRSFSHKTSGNVGDIIPIFVEPNILPGDTISIDTAKVIRFQTMLTPVMDQIFADVYWFFVPHRLVWDHWINLMGENTASAWIPETEYTVPTLVVPPPAGVGDTPNNNKRGTLLDYMGFPVEMPLEDSVKINALPFRAYSKVMNDWFRSESLTDPINLYTGDADVTCTTEASYIDDVGHAGKPFKAAKFADYFTSALPSPQRGDPVVISLNGEWSPDTSFLPVKARNYTHYKANDTGAYPASYANVSTSGTPVDGYGITSVGDKYYHTASTPYTVQTNSVSNQNGMTPNNLWADASNLSIDGLSFTVNDLRYAFQLQKLLERDARSGGRYIEVIKGHFNVDSPDQRLQRAEYLGGNRFAVTIDQVTNTAQTEQDFLGDLGANSVTVDVHSDFTKSFTEHGTLLGLLVLRTDKTYSQGLPQWMKQRTRFDYYWPVFANIGEQPIDKDELFVGAEGTFGYQEAWASWRYHPNMVSGLLRPYLDDGLASWTVADDYDSAPSLSDSWIREDKTNVDRILAVTSQISDQFWCDCYFKWTHTRPMPVYSIPGLIDHN